MIWRNEPTMPPYDQRSITISPEISLEGGGTSGGRWGECSMTHSRPMQTPNVIEGSTSFGETKPMSSAPSAGNQTWRNELYRQPSPVPHKTALPTPDGKRRNSQQNPPGARRASARSRLETTMSVVFDKNSIRPFRSISGSRAISRGPGRPIRPIFISISTPGGA